MELHEDKNKTYFNLIFLMTASKTTTFKTPTKESVQINNYEKHDREIRQIEQYIENTKEFQEKRIEQLTTRDTKRLSNLISKSSSLHTELKRLEKITTYKHNYENPEKSFKEQNKKIKKTAKELLDILK